MKSERPSPSTEAQSMSRWRAEAAALGVRASGFFADLHGEDATKTLRLAELAKTLHLPVYPVREFQLPPQLQACLAAIRATTAADEWRTAVKIVDRNGQVVFRRLGLDAADAAEAVSNAALPATVQLSPYREPDLSGTLWKRDGQLVVEFSRGPHFWLSKWAPSEACVVRARASVLDRRLRLEGAAPPERQMFSRLADRVCRAIFGQGLGAALALDTSVYAEFHWFDRLGLRFIECSFARAWTGASA